MIPPPLFSKEAAEVATRCQETFISCSELHRHHTRPVIPLSQCGNERKVFIFQFQSGITLKKQPQPQEDHEWKLSAAKHGASSSPEFCNSQMVCPLFFFFFSSFLSILYTCILVLWFDWGNYCIQPTSRRRALNLWKQQSLRWQYWVEAEWARVRWLSATPWPLIPFRKEG